MAHRGGEEFGRVDVHDAEGEFDASFAEVGEDRDEVRQVCETSRFRKTRTIQTQQIHQPSLLMNGIHMKLKTAAAMKPHARVGRRPK